MTNSSLRGLQRLGLVIVGAWSFLQTAISIPYNGSQSGVTHVGLGGLAGLRLTLVTVIAMFILVAAITLVISVMAFILFLALGGLLAFTFTDMLLKDLVTRDPVNGTAANVLRHANHFLLPRSQFRLAMAHRRIVLLV
jgi:hypothetical protein